MVQEQELSRDLRQDSGVYCSIIDEAGSPILSKLARDVLRPRIEARVAHGSFCNESCAVADHRGTHLNFTAQPQMAFRLVA